MKFRNKISVFALVALLALSSLGSLWAAFPAWAGGTALQDFEGWSDASGLTAAGGDPITGALVTEGTHGKALKLTVTGKDEAPQGNGLVQLPLLSADFSAGEGLTAWVKNLSDTAPIAVCTTFFANGEDPQGTVKTDMWAATHGSAITLVSSSGEETESNIVYGFVILPAGFEGYIKLPLNIFAGGWYGCTGPDLSQIGGFFFQFDTNGYRGLSMLFDDLALYTTPDPTPTTTVEVPTATVTAGTTPAVTPDSTPGATNASPLPTEPGGNTGENALVLPLAFIALAAAGGLTVMLGKRKSAGQKQ